MIFLGMNVLVDTATLCMRKIKEKKMNETKTKQIFFDIQQLNFSYKNSPLLNSEMNCRVHIAAVGSGDIGISYYQEVSTAGFYSAISLRERPAGD